MEPHYFPCPDDFAKWLDEHHASAKECLVGFHKKATSKPSMTWQESVEQALRFGWIDGVRRTVNEERYTIRFTPRKAKSGWSKVNVETAERLIAEGKMEPAGLKEVEAAKADGRFEAAYDSPSKATVPDDLQAALDKNKKAKAFFETLNAQNRYAILYRIQTAKKPETRRKRIEEYVRMLEEGRKFHP